MTRTRWTRTVIAPGAGLLALSILALPLVASAADVPDAAAPAFGGNFEMDLGAAPVRVAVDRPFLFHPVLDLQLFPSSAILNSVGGRQGSASLVGLGPVETAGGLLGQVIPSSAADVGSLLVGVPGLLGLPLPALPLPPLPADPFPPVPVPAVPPTPNTVNTNFPFTPDAQTGAGSFDGGAVVRSGSGTAESHASANAVSSQASAVSLSSGLLGPTGVLSIGAARSFTDGVVRADDVRGTATSILTDIDILGLVTIDSLKSVTDLVGDGRASASTSSVKLGRVTALGYPAVIDAKGVTITNNGVVPDSTVASLNSQLDQLLKAAGVTIRLAKDSVGSAKADATSRASSESAGLKIDVVNSPPSDVPVLGGSTTTVEIGLGYSRGSLLTGPDLGAGLGGGTSAAGVDAGGAAGSPAAGSNTGVDAAALPSLGGVGLDGAALSPGNVPGVGPTAVGPTTASSNQRLTSLNDDVTVANALANTRLQWVTVWPLLVVLAVALAMVANLVWARAAAARVLGTSAASSG